MSLVQVTVFLPEEQVNFLKRIAEVEGRTLAYVLSRSRFLLWHQGFRPARRLVRCKTIEQLPDPGYNRRLSPFPHSS